VARSWAARRSAPIRNVYRRMIQGAATIPASMIAESATTAIVTIRRATSQASSRPRDWSHSTKTGTKTDERIPPRASS